MLQYKILYRRQGSEKWAVLEPGAHATLYRVPAVDRGLEAIRDPVIEAVVVRHEGDLFNISRFDQEALAPNAFPLSEGLIPCV